MNIFQILTAISKRFILINLLEIALKTKRKTIYYTDSSRLSWSYMVFPVYAKQASIKSGQLHPVLRPREYDLTFLCTCFPRLHDLTHVNLREKQDLNDSTMNHRITNKVSNPTSVDHEESTHCFPLLCCYCSLLIISNVEIVKITCKQLNFAKRCQLFWRCYISTSCIIPSHKFNTQIRHKQHFTLYMDHRLLSLFRNVGEIFNYTYGQILTVLLPPPSSTHPPTTTTTPKGYCTNWSIQ